MPHPEPDAAPWIRPLSHPAPPDEAVLDAIVGTHGKAIAEAFVETRSNEFERAAASVAPFISSWPGDGADFATAWDHAFGRAQVAIGTRALEPAEVGARLALRLTECGHEGTWSASLPPSPLVLDSLLLRDVEGIEVNDVPEKRILARAGARTIECLRSSESGRWQADGGEPLAALDPAGRLKVLAGPALPGGGRDAQGYDADPVAEIEPAMIDSLRDGHRALARTAPEYVPWVERVLRGVVVCERQEDMQIESGSAEACPGVIHISHPQTPLEIAEILVHESSHQYFYIVERAGPVDDGSDQILYWSPPMRQARPLSRILIAYHALANVLLFYDRVRQSGIEDGGYVEEHCPRMREAVAELEQPLRGNLALSALGRGLYEPLAAQLAEARSNSAVH